MPAVLYFIFDLEKSMKLAQIFVKPNVEKEMFL
jgi:hypothetical protein